MFIGGLGGEFWILFEEDYCFVYLENIRDFLFEIAESNIIHIYEVLVSHLHLKE